MATSGTPIPNTSPIIIQYGYRYAGGDPATKNPLEDHNYCMTDVYIYPTLSAKGTIVIYGSNYYAVVFSGSGATYVDYWNLPGESGEYTRNCLNIGSDSIAFSMRTSMLADSYAYIQETGQILFAGANSIYYGHRNVNEIT